MAILSNPMAALATVNRLSGLSNLGAITAIGSDGGDPGGGTEGPTRKTPGTIADWKCMTSRPVSQSEWLACESWCQTNHPDKPCAVSCFYGSDGHGGCALLANCMECEEAPDTIDSP